MPDNPNPFGDESFGPETSPFDESLPDTPQPAPKQPPLPEVEPEPIESAPIPLAPIRPHQAQASQQAHPHRQAHDNQPSRPQYVSSKPSKTGWIPVWLLITAMSIGGGYFLLKAQKEMAEEAYELSFKPAKVRTDLDPSQDWQDLGFILRPGDQLFLTASGEYFNSDGGTITADGVPGTGSGNKNPRSLDPIFPHGCLIARTRGKPTEVFHIGAGSVMVPNAEGRLQIRVNDLDLVGNRGSLAVRAQTFLKQPPEGIKNRGSRDSYHVPVTR